MFRVNYSQRLCHLLAGLCLAIPTVSEAQTLLIDEADRRPELPVLIDGKPMYSDPSRFIPVEDFGRSPPTFLQQLQEYFQAATDAGITTADSLGQFVAEKYELATTSASDAATSSVNFINQVYNRAVKAGDTSAKSAQNWISDDIRKIGTWEYKLLEINDDPAAIEAALNNLGQKRWNCFAVMPRPNATIVYHFKRPHHSYLQQLPAKELLRLAPMLNFSNSTPE